MHRPRPTVVPGVQCREQIHDLTPAHLTDHNAVRAHAQGLSHKVPDCNGPRTLHIRNPGDEVDHVRMGWCQFGRVLDADDALGRINLCQHGREQSGLTGTGAAHDEKSEPGAHDRVQQSLRLPRQRAGSTQITQTVAGRAQHAKRNTGSPLGDGRQHRVQPDPEALPGRPLVFRQPAVHPGLRIVESATGRQRQPLGQPPDRRLVGKSDGYPFEAVATIRPHRIGRGHQHIGDLRIVQ